MIAEVPVQESADLAQLMGKLLALDQASQTTGFAIFDNKKLIVADTFTVSGDLPKRLVKIREKVSNLIDTYGITDAAIEDIQLQDSSSGVEIKQGVTTYRTLAEVRGVLEELFAEKKIPCTVVSSNSWKSYCKIKGKYRPEQKKNAQKYVLAEYGIDGSEDMADAICLGSYVNKEKVLGFDWSD